MVITQVKCLSLVVIPVLTTTLEDPHTKNNEVVTDVLVRGHYIPGGSTPPRALCTAVMPTTSIAKRVESAC